MAIITPAQIRKKALRFWTCQAFLKGEVTQTPVFPIRIPAGRVSSREMLDRFSAMQAAIRKLQQKSRSTLGRGYGITYRSVEHRKLGLQRMPAAITIDTREDFLFLIKKEGEADRFQRGFEQLMSALPGLYSLVEENPMMVVNYFPVLGQLVRVCRFFLAHPRPGKYIRELDIPGVDTKFIEAHRPILTQMLVRILPPAAVDQTVTGLAGHGFEKRFYLKYDMPLVRFRLLDPSLIGQFHLQDISTPIDDFASLQIPVKKVFITENKINGLSFPLVPGAMVIFGKGYGIQLLGQVPWLASRQIFYWGDIDTHGFAILSMIRHYFPHTRSFLMDRQTLFDYRPLWVREDDARRTAAALTHLDEKEQALYRELVDNVHGERIRLEQERISHAHVRTGALTVMHHCGGG